MPHVLSLLKLHAIICLIMLPSHMCRLGFAKGLSEGWQSVTDTCMSTCKMYNGAGAMPGAPRASEEDKGDAGHESKKQ